MRRCGACWFCAWLAIGLAAVILVLWGGDWWSVLLVALLLVCPALMLWGLIATRPPPLEAIPETRGMTLNWLAPVYEWYCPKIGLGDEFRQKTMRFAAILPGERVLEVGCGTGVLTRLAAAVAGPDGHAVGIDPAWKMIAVARRNAARASSPAEFRLAAIEALPFENETFDVVLASLMLHHLPPDVKRQGLGEAYRVLRPGGRLVAVDVDRPANILWWLVVWPLLLMPMTAANVRGEVPNFLREAGFQAVEAKAGWGRILTFWVAVKPNDQSESPPR